MLTGADGMFSSGYDIGDIPDDVFAVEAEKLVAHPFTDALDALDATDIPTVAALPGHTIGGGLELALCCDLRVAAEDIRLGMPPAKLGLVYSHTGLRRFLQSIGAPRTRELFLLGRNVDARTAELWGLVNRVADEDELRTSRSTSPASSPPTPAHVRGNKRVMRELLAADVRLDEHVERELIALREACFASEDMREGVRAFAEKRRRPLAGALTRPRMQRDRLTWWSYAVLASFAFLLNGFGPSCWRTARRPRPLADVAGLHSTGLAIGVLLAGAIGEALRRAGRVERRPVDRHRRPARRRAGSASRTTAP